MSATSQITSYFATSRSLHTNPPSGHVVHFFRYCHHALLGLIAAIGIFSWQNAHAKGAPPRETQTKETLATANILRQDILRFIGPVTEERVRQATVPDDAYLVKIYRKTNAPDRTPDEFYGILARQVDPTEQALFRDALDGKWDHFTLFQAAMIAEGVRDREQMLRYENRLDSLLAQVQKQLAADGSVTINGQVAPEILTRSLFEALHREILTQPYEFHCTSLSQVFETGHFNCVSATVLFNVLVEKAGLEVCGLEMPGHALSRVKFAGGSMNVETTAPNWFSLQSEPAKSQATLQRVARPISAEPLPRLGNSSDSLSLPFRQSATTATQNSASELAALSKKLREITPVQLIATIYYNQGVDLLQTEEYAEAALANVKALHLDPGSETAWVNLMATLNNWAIELTTEFKRYDLAAVLLDQGVYLDPHYDKFSMNQVYIYYYWMQELAMEGRVADAKVIFNYANQRVPNNQNLTQLMQWVSTL